MFSITCRSINHSFAIRRFPLPPDQQNHRQLGAPRSGFPIRLTSTNDMEPMNSFDIETPGEPNQIMPSSIYKTLGGSYFDPSSFVDAS